MITSDPPPAMRPSTMPPPDGRGARVLVVDRDPATRRALARALLGRGLSVDTAETSATALDLMRARPIDAVVLDREAAGDDGLARMRQRYPDVQVVLLVAHADPAAAAAGLAAGAHAVLGAPVESHDVLVGLAERAAERTRLAARVRKLEQQLAEHEHLGEIVTAQPAMLELLRRATAAAASSAHVLVLGEVGTGKSLLARTLHRRSNRARAPLVVWSPAVLSDDQAQAELAAVLHDADGATLLLEDLGELPPGAQRLLVDALSAPRRDGPRVIATARPELREEVTRGQVRKELFYGLASVLLEPPPLRRRRDDVPLLAYHFLSRFAADKPIRRIGQDALRLLRESPWPGNVTELRAAIEHAVVVARGEVIFPRDLPMHGPVHHDEEEPTRVELAGAEVFDLPYAEGKELAVARFDEAYVGRCLRIAGGNQSEAARLAGMDRSNFRRLAKRAEQAKKPR